MRATATVSLSLMALLSACQTSTTNTPVANEPAPPIAKRVAHELVAHGHTRVDNYYWLRDREDPEVIAYLEAENAYTQAATAHTATLRADLLAELTGRVVPDDSTAPVRSRDYFYYTRWVEGGEHPLYCRKHQSLEADEQIILNANALAKDHAYFDTGGLAFSENQQLMAYATDTVGRRFYTIYVQDLRTGALLADVIPNVSGDLEWANDDATLFYTKQDPETLRTHQLFRHTLGEDPAQDVLVYEEQDETFELGLWKTKSRAYLVLDSYSTLSNEARVLSAAAPQAEPRIIQSRERGLEYDVDHMGEHFFIRTNLEAKNFRLMKTPVNATTKQSWQEVVPHREGVLLEGFELFRDHLVLEQRSRGLTQLSIRRWDGGEAHELDFGEPAYLAYATGNDVLDTQTLRYSYSSMTTPDAEYDYDMNTRDKTLVKQLEVRGAFEPEDYVTERLDAPARDGVGVPISLVYRHDTPLDGSSALLVYAYGSYGASMDAEFSASVLSLLDRGFVYAIAHVRGGEELGRDWYEDGKLLRKQNTFTDFIDATEHLIDQGYGDRSKVFAEGGSAGGLLIGAVVNMRPDLYAGAIAAVPFVDVVTTMLDDSIPLTTSEYDEWGNPNEKQYYDYMLAYSPYDNVVAQDYPALLVTTGLHDSQVQYWEPAKWVAKLRATKTGDDVVLLRTDMSSGHGGKSGRLERYEEIAFDYAFLLDLAG
ncbi:Protease II [Enhygromyxa salina]|uniref:Protease II n=1 Tax=Enhygromyxa salina TaxID=215803 RepID=A0A0C1Z5D2_9BACT|nr:oligopeptidase B [Enhygromyxa salina]KIG12809.1 Protease II [Enhygromyxa salina]